MAKTDFRPLLHGFHFSNDFVNNIARTPLGRIESRGRCGGMAFAALDYYYAKILVPTHEGKDFPNGLYAPDQSILGDYIFRRSLHSLITTSAFKFLRWTVTRQGSMFNLECATRKVEFPKIKRSIDNGQPVVLGLIAGSKISEITRNHQVVAYGYDELAEDQMAIYIYDSNSPNEEVVIRTTPATPHFESSNGPVWRGVFVQDYRYRRPIYYDLVVDGNYEASKSSQSFASAYRIINRGQFPANLKYYALTCPNKLGLNYQDLVLESGETKLIEEEKFASWGG